MRAIIDAEPETILSLCQFAMDGLQKARNEMQAETEEQIPIISAWYHRHLELINSMEEKAKRAYKRKRAAIWKAAQA